MATALPLKWHNHCLTPIPGYPGYCASECGSIVSLWRSHGSGRGGVVRQVIGDKPKALRPDVRKSDGRKRYTLKHESGAYHRKYGSYFVLVACVGPRPDGMEACHNNGDCTDDSPANLRWDTPVANKADMLKHGTRATGEHHPKAKLMDIDIVAILKLRAMGCRLRVIGEMYGVSEQRIYQICKKGGR